jgi:hypothetical protein
MSFPLNTPATLSGTATREDDTGRVTAYAGDAIIWLQKPGDTAPTAYAVICDHTGYWELRLMLNLPGEWFWKFTIQQQPYGATEDEWFRVDTSFAPALTGIPIPLPPPPTGPNAVSNSGSFAISNTGEYAVGNM